MSGISRGSSPDNRWTTELMMPMKVFLDHDCLLHDPPYEYLSGERVPYFESPERINRIKKTLEQYPAIFRFVNPDPDIDPDLKRHILQVHAPDYLEYLERAYDEWTRDGGDKIAVFPDTFFHTKILPKRGGQDTLSPVAKAEACTVSTLAVLLRLIHFVTLSAAKQLLLNQPAAFALARPPGHHAGTALAGGYCYLNNAAIAARYLQNSMETDDRGVMKIAILDIDYHHGNGTQEIFYSDPSVLYASIHARDDYPYYTGSKEETGYGVGEGFNFNCPLPKGTTDGDYCSALQAVMGTVEKFDPYYLVVSLGVDTYLDDPISEFKLSRTCYTDIGQMIGAVRKPTLFVMEGGYHLDTIGGNVFSILEGFLSVSGR